MYRNKRNQFVGPEKDLMQLKVILDRKSEAPHQLLGPCPWQYKDILLEYPPMHVPWSHILSYNPSWELQETGEPDWEYCCFRLVQTEDLLRWELEMWLTVWGDDMTSHSKPPPLQPPPTPANPSTLPTLPTTQVTTLTIPTPSRFINLPLYQHF